MLVTYIRSSSYGTHDMCAQSYLLDYCIGWRQPANWKAERGTIVHKALEILARRKKAEQDGLVVFREEEALGGLDLPITVSPDEAVDIAWKHYTDKGPCEGHVWTWEDHEDCRKFTKHVLNFNDGMFSPLKRTIIQPEQYFDFQIDEPWAAYDYLLPDGNRLKGQLALKGTVDLILDVKSPEIIEYCDWKTGRRWDWARDREKTPKKLQEDPQLRLYHYALSRLYPQAKTIIMTIFFVADGGPYTMAFDKSDLDKTTSMIRQKFETIKSTQRPRLNKSWKCTKLCDYGKTRWEKNRYVDWTVAPEGRGKTICEHMRNEVVTLGLDKVMDKYGNIKKTMAYGSGGGAVRD
jgi:hypothetical protein